MNARAELAIRKLEGKVIIVTGSSQGIGQGVAEHLARCGADIVVNYHANTAGAEETRKRVESAGRKALVVRADVSKPDEIRLLFDRAIAFFGRVDVLINNAGIDGRNADFWDTTEEDFDRVVDLNLKGAFFCAQAFVKHLRETRRGGKIINISSVHEEMAFPHFTPYCCSKGGLMMMMRNLAVELAPLGITVNNIAPGAIETPINAALLADPVKLNSLLGNIPLKRLGTPADIAPAVAYLASDEADYITGATFVIDGGLMRNYHEQ